MNQGISSFVSVDGEIKRISKELLAEAKIHQQTTIKSAEDDQATKAGIKYLRSDVVPLMNEMGLVEIVEVDENLVYKNRHSGDTTLFKYPIYQVKINISQINKFLQNPDSRVFLEDNSQPLIYSPEDIIAQNDALSIVKKSKRTAYLYYEGLKPSKPVTIKSAWFKVFLSFIKHSRLERQDMLAIWNTAGKGSLTRKKKTRNAEDIHYVRREVKKGIKTASEDIAQKIEIKKGEDYFADSYFLEIK